MPGAMTVTAIKEFTTDEIDKSDLSIFDLRARGLRNYLKGGGPALQVERQVSGRARQVLPTLYPEGFHTHPTQLPPLCARASVPGCAPH